VPARADAKEAQPRGTLPEQDALAVYVALLLGVAVWNMSPPPGPPEFAIPGPEVYRAQRTVLELRLMALHCIKDASPARCSRPDVQRIQAHYFLKWLDEVPGIFEGEPDWANGLDKCQEAAPSVRTLTGPNKAARKRSGRETSVHALVRNYQSFARGPVALGGCLVGLGWVGTHTRSSPPSQVG
jgi:hypothetical protein